jgi:hypothetical protein
MPAIYNPLFFKYKLKCTFPGCFGRAEIDQATSAGWSIGYTVPEDGTHPEVGRCPACKRYQMQIVTAPPDPVPVKPVGWNKVPTS